MQSTRSINLKYSWQIFILYENGLKRFRQVSFCLLTQLMMVILLFHHVFYVNPSQNTLTMSLKFIDIQGILYD